MSLAEIESENRLFTGVQLLTLSACNTAFTNRDEDGREVDSFGMIAQQQGAKAVVASLWSVSDDSTAQLMKEMYRLREQTGMPKGEALRKAQEEMLTGALGSAGGHPDRGMRVVPVTAPSARSWNHPFFWAPFILIGNWN
jgi:CHAT domain-containing protein